jgi:hypothetical protein
MATDHKADAALATDPMHHPLVLLHQLRCRVGAQHALLLAVLAQVVGLAGSLDWSALLGTAFAHLDAAVFDAEDNETAVRAAKLEAAEIVSEARIALTNAAAPSTGVH